MALCGVDCGGKILDEGVEESATSAEDDGDAGSATLGTLPGTTPPEDLSLEEACGRTCDVRGRCGAQTPECEKSCLAKGGGACAEAFASYVRCDARRPACNLHPSCEGAYCAYLRCMNAPGVPGYCR